MPGVALLHQAHLAERAAPDHLQRVEVADADARAAQAQELGLLERVLLSASLTVPRRRFAEQAGSLFSVS